MSEFSEGIKAAAWPTHDPQLFHGIAEHQEQRAAALREAADGSYAVWRPRFAQQLQGASGDALVASHDENVARWLRHAGAHDAAGAVAREVGHEHEQLRYELGLLIDEGEPKYRQAVQKGHPEVAGEIFATYHAEAVGLATDAAGRISGVLGTNPLAPVGDTGVGGDTPDGRHHGLEPERGEPSADTAAAAAPVGDARHNALPPAAPGGGAPHVAPVSPLGVTSPAASAGSAPMSSVGSLGSGLSAPSVSSPLGALSGVSSSGLSSAAPKMTGAAGSMQPANVGAAFTSGLQAGLGGASSSGLAGLGSSAPPPSASAPLAPFASTPPAAASVAAAGPVAAGPVDLGPPLSGSSGGLTGAAGPMAAPMVASGGQLAPYNLPGAGPGAGVPTTVATSPAAYTSPSSPGAAGPVMAGTSGATSAAAAASVDEENPDLAKARRILAELVHGTDASAVETPLTWAVMVLQAASGAYTFAASSVGDGRYLPSRVYLPKNVDLAAPAPQFTGKPSAILAEHFRQIKDAMFDPRVSVLVTTQTQAQRPRCGGSWEVMSTYEAQRLPGEAPQLDGWHRHRLEASDAGMWSRLQAIDQAAAAEIRPQIAHTLAQTITTAVLAAATEDRNGFIAELRACWDPGAAEGVADVVYLGLVSGHREAVEVAINAAETLN